MDQEILEWRSQERLERTTTIQRVFCSKWNQGTSEEIVEVVLAKSQMGQILELAHDIPMAGHIGQECTVEPQYSGHSIKQPTRSLLQPAS